MAPVDQKARQMANRARAAREAAGLSQVQAAKKLKIPRSSLTEAEACNRKISASELIEMAVVYGVGLAWLAGSDASAETDNGARVDLAARELSRLRKDDLDAVLRLIRSIRQRGERE